MDHRADIWALGMVMAEMLTGTRPFAGDAESYAGSMATALTAAEVTNNAVVLAAHDDSP